MDRIAHKLLYIVIVILWLGAVLPVSVYAQRDGEANPQLESAILREDWSRVANLFSLDDTSAPVARLIKAHALLALNRNNDSLCLFFNTSTEEDLQQWKKWTALFVQQNSRNPIGHYFYGDALARLRQWDSAVVELREALKIRADHALVLNARGVINAAKAEWNQAIKDFYAATKANPRLADSYASRGAMYIQKKTGAPGALKAFTKALELSPDFVLALNGRGGVHVVLGDWDNAQTDLANAQEKAPKCLSGILDTVHLNALALIDAESEVFKAPEQARRSESWYGNA